MSQTQDLLREWEHSPWDFANSSVGDFPSQQISIAKYAADYLQARIRVNLYPVRDHRHCYWIEFITEGWGGFPTFKLKRSDLQFNPRRIPRRIKDRIRSALDAYKEDAVVAAIQQLG